MLSFARASLVLVASALFLGCGPAEEEPAFSFGEKDMQDAVLGSWNGSMTLNGGAATTFTLSVTQAPPGTSPACASRTFNEPLCVESTSMNLDATLTTADGKFTELPMKGSFFVIGLNLDRGDFSLGGTGISLSGGIELDKTSQELNISGDQSGTATMTR